MTKVKKVVEQARYRSATVWAGIASQVLTILLLTGILNVAEGKVFELIVAAVLQVLVVFGILNNPTTKGKF